MPVVPEIVAGLNIRDDDEGLFSRDISGQLVRLDAPTENDYDKKVTLQIDGQPITVPLAEPLKDANGNVVVDLAGRTTPRYTTIYDAAAKLYVRQIGDSTKIPIPILCHQPHMNPVAVCRLCVVQIYGQKRGKRAAERKLLPACQHQVKEGMEVFTMNAEGPDGDRVRQTVKIMTELLDADHLKPTEPPEMAQALSPFNELGQMTHRTGSNEARFRLPELSNPPPEPPPRVGRRPFDVSSPVFVVDHTSCILCERCIRACTDVMHNNVIGRTGKGNTAGISFDFNDAMGSSSCVKCGECMVSCPTSAISFKPVAQIRLKQTDRSAEVLPAAELTQDPMFAGVPPKFLFWQQGLVIRRRTKPGEILCHQGDAGNTAYIIKKGRLEISVYSSPGGKGKQVFRGEVSPSDLMVGEMACLSGTPRTANVTALEEGEVWEVRRNVLDRLMRLPSLRERFEAEFRQRALNLVLQGTDLFRSITGQEYNDIVAFLGDKLNFIRVRPGQVLFEQGDRVDDLYIIRIGHVRVGVQRYGQETRVVSCGPGTILGEIGLLSLSTADLTKTIEQVDQGIKNTLDAAGDQLADAFAAGTRTATCSALGHLEMAQVRRVDFLDAVKRFPQLRRRLVEQSLARLRSDDQGQSVFSDYVEQGLYEGQSILVLDTDLCTRCDECTRGCVEQHGTESHGIPLTRLIRDGRRFEHFLIATSCRSCTDPHCMFGCPVDSIHRGKHLQIVIEDHCIGCGLCASNCPYGSIFMMPNQNRRIEAPDPEHPGKTKKIAQPKAVVCDLCDAHGERSTPKPRCVAACPHEAASRVTGEELLGRIMMSNRKRR